MKSHRQRSGMRAVVSEAVAGADVSPGSSNALSASESMANVARRGLALFQITKGRIGKKTVQKLISI